MQILVPADACVADHPLTRVTRQKRLTPAMRRAWVDRFERDREQFSSIPAFAKVEAQRLYQQGYVVRPQTIYRYIWLRRAHPLAPFKYERLLAAMQRKNPRTGTFWHDPGDLCAAAGIATQNQFHQEVKRLRARGVEIRRCHTPLSEERERGWQWQYRLWEA